MKRFIAIFFAMLFLVYLLFSAINFSHKPAGVICERIDLRIYDSLNYGLITEEFILKLLEKKGLNPIGENLENINIDNIEKVLISHQLIAGAECYRTIGHTLKIRIESRTPILRVKSQDGSDYYLGSRGEFIDHSLGVIHIPVATGNIDREFAKRELLALMEVVNKDPFWKAQTQQIHVSQNKEIELYPRVGGHLLLLGLAEDVQNKLDRLYNFYHKGLSEIGWNKYSSISVAYKNQIICKKQ
ncbi:MAG TPA: cell division protein FtsQ [Bacteroidaceae bacterium]|nr:cell division protein FtsQ [Bacteroidaceae bacterium]